MCPSVITKMKAQWAQAGRTGIRNNRIAQGAASTAQLQVPDGTEAVQSSWAACWSIFVSEARMVFFPLKDEVLYRK